MLEDKDYDDSDRVVWEDVYSKAYAKKIIGERFDINNSDESKERKRIVAKDFKEDQEIGGETDFNFSSKLGNHRKSKYGIYEDILKSINDENQKKEALKLLKYCKKMTYKIDDFSLMLCDGSLQTLKGTLDKDRIDLFIYLLDNYYRGKDEVILSHCVPAYEEKLKRFLNLFEDKNDSKESIYKYCKEIYHISNRTLVKDLIKSGRRAINTPERVIEYMKLAVRFWNCKAAYYQYCNMLELESIEI